MSERNQYRPSEYLGDESAVSRLNELEEDLLSSGVRVERTCSARTSAMPIYLDDALLDQIGLLVDRVNEILTRGSKCGALEIPKESLRVTTVVQDRLQEQAGSAEVGRLGQCLKNVNVDQGVSAEVRARVEALKAAIESNARSSLRSAVVDEFVFTVPDETTRLLLSRFIQRIGLKENPYLVVVSDATQAITALGVHVWSANSPKGRHISFLTLRQNMIVIPLST